MGWFLQTPGDKHPKLLQKILEQCGTAEKGGGAFAFASARGIKMLTGEPAFTKFIEAYEFTMIVGLDAITDLRALDELQKLTTIHHNFKAKLFLHSSGGSLFHPKTLWLKTSKGGVVITGSGNLTSGGLKSNWEAMAIDELSAAEMSAIETSWDDWIKAHEKELVEVDDPQAIAKAKANEIVRDKIKKALKKNGAAEADLAEEHLEGILEVSEEVENEILIRPVLIAEVPKSGNRWQQVNFDLRSYQQFFGVTPIATRHVRFYDVKPDGTLGEPEDRQGVSVVSQNFRFEVGAAAGKPYPPRGHPICIFMQTNENTFHYVLLLPGDAAHTTIQAYLDGTYVRTHKKLRVQMTAGTLRRVWPDAPFFK